MGVGARSSGYSMAVAKVPDFETKVGPLWPGSDSAICGTYIGREVNRES